MSNLFKRLRIPLLLIALLAIIATTVSRYTSLNWFIENDNWLRQQIVAAPISSFVLALILYLIASLIPGFAGKSIVLGWFFGAAVGVVIVNFALVGAALITFVVCRHYLQSMVEARFGIYLRPFQRRIDQDGAWYMLAVRLAHVPFSFTNYAAGTGTEIPFRTFWWTTQLGLLPGNIIFVYAGARLRRP